MDCLFFCLVVCLFDLLLMCLVVCSRVCVLVRLRVRLLGSTGVLACLLTRSITTLIACVRV